MINRRCLLNYTPAETWALFHFDSTSATEETGNSELGLYTNTYSTSTSYYNFGSRSFWSNARSGYMYINLPPTVFTVECWVYCPGQTWNNSTSYNQLLTFSDRNPTNETNLHFYINDVSTYASYLAISNYNSNFNIVTYDTTQSDYYYYNFNSWKHLAVTYDRSTINIYINGYLVAYSSDSYFDTSLWGLGTAIQNYPAFSIGNRSYGVYGYIDELRVSSKILYSGSSFTVPSSAFTV